MRSLSVFRNLSQCVSNSLDWRLLEGKLLTGIIGDRPSQYAKSPSIWNPVIQLLGIEAVYVPFDVPHVQLGSLMECIRALGHFHGGSVTVPYKVSIIPLLDRLDIKAQQIGAVNVIVRTPQGELVGYNTDGQGGIDALTKLQPGHSQPFVKRLNGLTVLLVGAGGAARALAFYLADELKDGKLVIANRDPEKSNQLAENINAVYGNTTAVSMDGAAAGLAGFDLIVNATTCGQSGLRVIPDRQVTSLEPYSPLASAMPFSVSEAMAEEPEKFYRSWIENSLDDICRNNSRTWRMLADLPRPVRFFDIIYSPLETTFLRQARLAGHLTLNGKPMNIAQAAASFFHLVFYSYLEDRGIYTDETFQKVLEKMYAVW